MKLSQLRKRALAALLLLTAFIFRLSFGLSSDFWTDDEKQIYLIGLKFYATGAWPYFGPDVTNTIQIPGALQGLIVALPLFLLPIPEAPYVLLNLLSLSALSFFAWYCCKRLPKVPGWFIWTWLLIAPWTLNLSTHVFNPSYVLFGSVLFFIGALETYPFLTLKLVPLRWANFLMGFGLCWLMQFHLSWIILLPFLLFSIYLQYRRGDGILNNLAFFGLGATITGSLMIPTFAKYGFLGGLGGTTGVVQFDSAVFLRHLNLAEGILGRFFSFASYELPRFIGNNTEARLMFLRDNSWLIPFAIFLGVVGVLQTIALIFLWFRKRLPQQDWRAMKYLTLGTLCVLYVSFLFSLKEPHSHTFYLVFPIAMLYSLYCWSPFLTRRSWQSFAVVFLICGVVFSAGLGFNNLRRKSLYLDRKVPAAAISQKDHTILGTRREGSRY